MTAPEILKGLPGKDCGLCGVKTCADFAPIGAADPDAIKRCTQLSLEHACGAAAHAAEQFSPKVTWKDFLGRDFDFILDKFPDEQGPRETVIPFNPANVEKLKLKKGDVCYGRPGWISCGCPVTHVGVIVDEPDYFNGIFTWNIVGPLRARESGINIGCYNTTAYEGLVKVSRVELEIGRRYHFQPRCCMLQWRHCGLVNQLAKTEAGLRVRLEGLWIG